MIETLHDNPWLSLQVVRDPERGVNGYVFSHETRCQGRIVAVLPYRETPTGRVYMVRQETTPCWSMEQQLSAVTGGYEGGDIADDAVREVAEETGYVITCDDLIDLGESYASKSSDTVYSLFAVDLTGRTPGAAAGDGSRLEAEGSTAWLLDNALAHVKDPQVALMYVRLEMQLAARAHLSALAAAPKPSEEEGPHRPPAPVPGRSALPREAPCEVAAGRCGAL